MKQTRFVFKGLMCKSKFIEGYLPKLYLTTHNIQKGQALMTLAGFEPPTPASKWP
jgi:hypothetical protein